MSNKKSIIIIAVVASFLFNFSLIGISFAAECGGVQTSLISCDKGDQDSLGGVGALLKEIYKILNYLIIIVAVAGTVYGGILYTTAGGNSEQTKKAISYIRNVIIGLIAWALMYAILNWLVPGGVPIL